MYKCSLYFRPKWNAAIARAHNNQNQIWLANIGEYIRGYTVLGSIVGSDYHHSVPEYKEILYINIKSISDQSGSIFGTASGTIDINHTPRQQKVTW